MSGLLLLFDLTGFDDREDVFLFHDEIILAVELDLLARVLAEEDQVASLDVGRLARAIISDLAGAGGDDLALLRLFLRAIGDDDPADLLFALVEALDEDAVVERSDIHGLRLQIERECADRTRGANNGGE